MSAGRKAAVAAFEAEVGIAELAVQRAQVHTAEEVDCKSDQPEAGMDYTADEAQQQAGADEHSGVAPGLAEPADAAAASALFAGRHNHSLGKQLVRRQVWLLPPLLREHQAIVGPRRTTADCKQNARLADDAAAKPKKKDPEGPVEAAGDQEAAEDGGRKDKTASERMDFCSSLGLLAMLSLSVVAADDDGEPARCLLARG